MIRCIRKLFTLAVVLVLLAAFGYSVVLPRVLPLQYRENGQRRRWDLIPQPLT